MKLGLASKKRVLKRKEKILADLSTNNLEATTFEKIVLVFVRGEDEYYYERKKFKITKTALPTGLDNIACGEKIIDTNLSLEWDLFLSVVSELNLNAHSLEPGLQ